MCPIAHSSGNVDYPPSNSLSSPNRCGPFPTGFDGTNVYYTNTNLGNACGIPPPSPPPPAPPMPPPASQASILLQVKVEGIISWPWDGLACDMCFFILIHAAILCTSRSELTWATRPPSRPGTRPGTPTPALGPGSGEGTQGLGRGLRRGTPTPALGPGSGEGTGGVHP